MKKYSANLFLLISILCFCILDLPAQENKIDSLENCLKLSKEDTAKVQIYRSLFYLSDSLFYAEAALKLSEKNNYTKGIAASLFTIGTYYYSNEKYDISLDYLIKAKKMAETAGYKKLLSSVYKYIGFIYRPTDPSTAIEYYVKSLRILEEMHDELSASYLLSAIGNVYEGTHGINKESKHENAALDYYLQSLKIRERIGGDNEVASSLNETSRMYEQLGKHDIAAGLRQRGLRIAEKAESYDNIVFLCNLIGQDFFRLHDYKNALKYHSRAYEIISKDANTNYGMMSQVVKSLASTYSALNNYKKSSEYFNLFIVCNDSVKARVNTANLTNLKHAMAAEKEKQQLLLKDSEIEKQKAIVDKQIILRNAFLFAFAVVIALVIFIFKGYRQKQKTNRELNIYNKKIEFAYKLIKEKTIAITDSIHYALRIQKATLPHRRDIWAALPNSFIFYKPKDIVSGDFYWFTKKEHLVFIAALDCTGHGVPGAFMSIIGAERLNDAVQNENNPSKILSFLNKGIKTSLRQSENIESTRDGMDIALCSIDLKSSILSYAGANRPIWIIRKNSTNIEEIKATKTAIGGLTEDDHFFETHTIQLEEGDTFYIFTDGYADQDGGEKGKKLMTKKFKQMLLGMQDITMKEQEADLEALFEKWRGKKDQLDDILIIGIRL